MPGQKLLLSTERKQSRAEAAVKTPGRFSKPQVVVWWGGERIEGRWKDGTVEHQTNGVMKLDATLLGKFRRHGVRERMRAYLMLADEEVPLFVGNVTIVEHAGTETEVVASSDGRNLEKRSFNERYEFAGGTVSDLIYDAMSRVYPSSQVNIEYLESPRLNYGADAEVKVLNAVEEGERLGQLVHFDHPEGGVIGIRKPDLLYPGDPMWVYNVQSDVPAGGFRPKQEDDDEDDYESVVIYRRGSDNFYEFGPVEFEVSYNGMPSVKNGNKKWVEISEEDQARAFDYAYNFGSQLANAMGRGKWRVDLEVPINPFILPMNTVHVYEEEYGEEGAFAREWAWVVNENIKHTLPNDSARETTFGMRGILLSEESLPIKAQNRRTIYSGVRDIHAPATITGWALMPRSGLYPRSSLYPGGF